MNAVLPRVSVIVPVLNEERRIAEQLAALARQPGVWEIVVVDGGSSDRTVEQAVATGVARIVHAERGRGRQMNAGAAVATGDVLWFVHADVRPPWNGVEHIARAFEEREVVAGAFRTWTVADERAAWWSFLLHLADFRSRYSGLPYGDQALFVKADAFRQAGGFPEIPLFEDLELSRTLSRIGRVRILPQPVLVSGRRFVARPVFFFVLDNVLPLLHRAGVSPRRLAALYGDQR